MVQTQINYYINNLLYFRKTSEKLLVKMNNIVEYLKDFSVFSDAEHVTQANTLDMIKEMKGN